MTAAFKIESDSQSGRLTGHENATWTPGAAAVDRDQIRRMISIADDVYSVAARRVASGQTIVYPARDVLGLND